MYSRSQVGSFVYRPGASHAESHSSFEVPRAGQPVYGQMYLRARSDIPDAKLCVLEYSLGSDSARRSWQMIGSFPKTQDCFVGRWDPDSVVKREGKAFGCPCTLRATVLGRQGQHDETLLETVVTQPPAPTRRGCGCGH
jgi:hypothetical protein